MPGVFRQVRQWLFKASERALNQAYEAATRIEAIEQQYFDGKRVSPANADYGQSAMAYFETEVKKNLGQIKRRMGEFRASNAMLPSAPTGAIEVQPADAIVNGTPVNRLNQPAIWLKKMRFIDGVVARYDQLDPTTAALVSTPESRLTNLGDSPNAPKEGIPADALTDRANFLPRSILRTVDRIRQDLDPKAETDVVRNFRSSKAKTSIALRFVLLLIIVPLLTQQVSKNIVVGIPLEWLRTRSAPESLLDRTFLNIEMEEEALHELQQFEERLRFEVLIGKAPPMPELAIEQRVRDKAEEIEADYRQLSIDAVKNVFADILAAIAFALLLITSKREIAVLKSFIDEVVYGLSDSAKAFIIILLTDVFVGFHSPHGWEVLLEGMSRHFGFPANREFIFLFIATFPVILDTVFKYWIFRYLNRISPSAVATYKNMNE
jgi:hypothetical protein